jgi:hypothetical protein
VALRAAFPQPYPRVGDTRADLHGACGAHGHRRIRLGTLLVAPTFRLRSHYLAIATLGIGEIVRLVILNWDGLTRGAMGLPNIPPLSFAGRLIVDPRSLYWASFGLLVLVAVLQTALVRSSVGRAVKAIRDDEKAVASRGIGPDRYKSLAFAASAFVAGIAGAFTAHMYSYINSETFSNTTRIRRLPLSRVRAHPRPARALPAQRSVRNRLRRTGMALLDVRGDRRPDP